MCRAIILLVPFAIIGWAAVDAGEPHPVARPWDGWVEPVEPSAPMPVEAIRIPIDELTAGADHVIAQQCQNGGFGWPHDDCSATVHAITGPIMVGVLDTYAYSMDGFHLASALNGGVFELAYTYDNGEARFPAFTPYFLHRLAIAADNTTFSTHVAENLFDELAAGTYGPDDYDTAGWIANIQAGRSGAWINLRPWEFHNLIPTAQALGQPGQAALFEQAVLDGLATLDNSDATTVFNDIIGIAGAVRGLAAAGRTSFPAISAPLHPGVNGIDTLEGLAAYLASLQQADGSWYWHSNLAAPTDTDKDVQTTAYSLLALLEADPLTAASYVGEVGMAQQWLLSMQLPNGGFPEYPGGDENTEVEGEALSAIAAFETTIFVDGFETGDLSRWSGQAP